MFHKNLSVPVTSSLIEKKSQRYKSIPFNVSKVFFNANVMALNKKPMPI